MSAKYILAAFASALLFAAIARIARDGGALHSQSRAWLLIAGIFAIVSTWLWLGQ